VWLDFVGFYEGDYVAGIKPSKLAQLPVAPKGSLAVRWAALKSAP
jgi:hypothetical protein